MLSIFPTVNHVKTDTCLLILVSLSSGYDQNLHLYLHYSEGLSHFAKFKQILLFPLCSQLAFHNIFIFVHFFQRNFSLWFSCFVMGTFKMIISSMSPHFLDWGNMSLLWPMNSQKSFACRYLTLYPFFREQFLSFYFW